MTTERYCLLLAREQEFNVGAVARSAAEFFDAPLPEITTTIRKGGGFLASAMPRVIAAEMQRRLDALGVETLLLPHSSIEPLPHPFAVRAAELGAEALITVERRGAPERPVPYEQIMFLSVSVLMRPEAPREARGKGSKNIGDTLHKFNPLRMFHESLERSVIRPRRRADVLLDVYTKKPYDCYRMSRGDLDYRRLGGGMSDTARENFPALVQAIRGKAPRAYVTERTRQFLAGSEPERVAFADMPEVNRYHTWLLNVLGSR